MPDLETTQPGDAHQASRHRLSPAAFAARFEQASRLFCCIAAGVLGSPDQAEDVVQEAASVALTKLDEYHPNTNFTAWMAQIVRYVALNTARKQRRRSQEMIHHDGLLNSMSTKGSENPHSSPLTNRGDIADDQTSFDDEVLQALQCLDETARVCLLLRTLRELSYREISQILDIPPGTAMSHVHRARRQMRETLTTGGNKEGRTR